jgi:hypothetical protein
MEDIEAIIKSTPLKKEGPEKPVGWTSTAGYYTLRYAKEIQPHLDALILSDQEGKRKEAVFNAIKLRKKVNTLYTQITQGWRYLYEQQDPDGKYLVLRQKMSVLKQGKVVRISWNKVGRSVATPDVDLVDADVDWRGELVRYVEDSTDGECGAYERKALDLNDSELDWLVNYLASIDTIVATIRVSANGFKIIKNSELAAEIKKKRETIE